MKNLGPYIDVTSGNKVYFLHPEPDQITIEDIAEGLSKICRFYGHCKFYSVAEHSVRVSRILPPNLKLAGLLHDGSEAFIGDIHSFLKQLIPQYKIIEHNFEKVIAERFGLEYPNPSAVKIADLTLLTTEKRDLKKHSDWKDSLYLPLKEKITPWSSKEAKKEFLKEFKKLTK